MFFVSEERLRRIVGEAVENAVPDDDEDTEGLTDQVVRLKTQIADLEISKAKKQEEYDRKEREIEHKVGLERKRQEQEIGLAKRETTVTVREENLEADQERFKNEMDFQRKRLEEEVTSLRELVGQMLERLPSAQIIASTEVKRGRARV